MPNESTRYYVGVDGCPGGWMVVAQRMSLWSAKVYSNIDDIVSDFGSRSLYLIDIPMGLADQDTTRTVEKDLRQLLSPVRHQSVFSPPVRDAIYANNYRQALEINRQQKGKGISIQAWNISGKIREMDQFLINHSHMRSQFYESHPELCFLQLNKGHLPASKHSHEGRQARRNLLLAKSNLIKKIMGKPPKGATEIDLMDAAVLSLTAATELKFIKNSTEMDSKQIPIRIVY